MSKKNKDEKNRFRSRTIAFRLSPEEADELDMRWKISGYRIKQDFIRDSLFHQRVVARENPQMLTSMKKYLLRIEKQLQNRECIQDSGDEILVTLQRMLEILEAF